MHLYAERKTGEIQHCALSAKHITTTCNVVIQCNGTIIVTHRLLDDKGTYRSFHLDLKVQHDFRQIL